MLALKLSWTYFPHNILEVFISRGILPKMTVDTLIMLSGTFIALLPFLGFPLELRKMLFIGSGIFIIALGIVVRRKGEQLYRTPLRAADDEKLEIQGSNETKT